MQLPNHLHVETHGPEGGPAVVLLHHGLGSTRSWRKQIPALVEAGYRVLVYDRWGYGKSDARPCLEVPSFQDDLADLENLLAACNFPLVTFLGHSDGGSIALYYALQHPEQVNALVTIAAHIYLEEKMESGVQGIRQAFEHDPRFREGLRRAHGEKYETTFYNWFNGWHTPKALEWDMRPQLAQIKCPALVIQGEEDEHATPQHARAIAENIPNAQLWLIPEARHMLPQEQSELLNPKLLEFLQDVR